METPPNAQEEKVVIKRTLFAYGPHTYVSYLCENAHGEIFLTPREMKAYPGMQKEMTREEAEEWIDREDSRVYILDSNESGRPDYVMLPVSDLIKDIHKNVV